VTRTPPVGDALGRRRSAAAGRTVARALLLAVLVATLLLPAGHATADPARPTHYRATVTGVVDATGQPLTAVDAGSLAVEVLGGDAFLVVRAAPGTTVMVPGYEGEPYLRIAADGTVEVNVRSPARWLNDARYGARDVQVPPQADTDAPPEWEVVARNGTYAWHDHRIHVMTPVLPPQIDRNDGTVQRVWDTVVPLEVDGQAVEVRIDLDWVPGAPPLVGGLLVLFATVAWLGLLLLLPAATGLVLAAVASAALGVGVATWVASPPGGDVEPALVVLPALALVLQLVGRGVGRLRVGVTPPPVPGTSHAVADRPVGVASWLEVGAAVPLAVWGILLAPALVRPIVPGPLPVWVVRGVTAAALATGVAVMVVAARRLLTRPQTEPTG
jgi:hypothetical protein